MSPLCPPPTMIASYAVTARDAIVRPCSSPGSPSPWPCSSSSRRPHSAPRRPSTPTAAARSRTERRATRRRASPRTRTRPATASCSRWTRSSPRTACRSRCTTPRSTGPPIAAASCARSRSPSCSACRTDVLGSPGSPLPTRGAARPVAIATIAQVLEFARRTGAKVNLEIKNVPGDPDFDTTPAYANSVMDAVLASRIPRSQLLDPELHSRQPRRGAAAHARGGHQPAVHPGDQRAIPPGGGRPELRLHLTRVARERGLRAPGARPRSRRGALHARHGGRRSRREARQGRCADHRRPADGSPRARPAPAGLLQRRCVHRRAPGSSPRAICSRRAACRRDRDVAARSRCA